MLVEVALVVITGPQVRMPPPSSAAAWSLSVWRAEAGSFQPPRGFPLLALRSQCSRKGAGVKNDSTLLFWVTGPHQGGHFLFISQAVCGCRVATSVAAFLGLLRSQLRFIRDPVNHNRRRTCL